MITLLSKTLCHVYAQLQWINVTSLGNVTPALAVVYGAHSWADHGWRLDTIPRPIHRPSSPVSTHQPTNWPGPGGTIQHYITVNILQEVSENKASF